MAQSSKRHRAIRFGPELHQRRSWCLSAPATCYGVDNFGRIRRLQQPVSEFLHDSVTTIINSVPPIISVSVASALATTPVGSPGDSANGNFHRHRQRREFRQSRYQRRFRLELGTWQEGERNSRDGSRRDPQAHPIAEGEPELSITGVGNAGQRFYLPGNNDNGKLVVRRQLLLLLRQARRQIRRRRELLRRPQRQLRWLECR